MTSQQQKNFFSLIGSLFLAFFIVIAVMIAGDGIDKAFPQHGLLLALLCASFGALFVAMVAVLQIVDRKYLKKMNERKVADANREYDAEKDAVRAANAAEGNPEAAGKKLRRSIALARIYFGIMTVSVTASLLFSMTKKAGVLCLTCFIMAYAYFSSLSFLHIRHSMERYDWSEYSVKEDYPDLYELAGKAKNVCGIKGKLRILVCPGYGASIVRVRKGKNGIALDIGIELAALLDREELYCVMLHELSHLEYSKSPTDNFFCDCLLNGWDGQDDDSIKFMMYPVSFFFYRYFVGRIYYESVKYKLMTSEFIERIADKKGASRTDANVFASALVKTYMSNEIERIWAYYLSADDLFYRNEKAPENWYTFCTGLNRRIFEENHEKWFECLPSEIQSRTATHPVIRDRLANIGVNVADVKYKLTDPDPNTPYGRDILKAIEFLNKKTVELNADDYESNRKSHYLEPMETVEAFVKNGRESSPEDHRKLLWSMGLLCMYDEAVAFCKNVLADESVSDFSKTVPMTWYGQYLLNHDDDSGLALLYKAAETNDNHMDEASDAIGAYCCRRGLADELAKYRERASGWLQKQQDLGKQKVTLAPGDNLSAETFSPEKMKRLTDFILGRGNDVVKRIFLVHKQINDTPDGYVSIFVLDYTDESEFQARQDLYDAVFNYLDTDSEGWSYSLLSYDPKYQKIFDKIDGCLVYEKKKAKSLLEEDAE